MLKRYIIKGFISVIAVATLLTVLCGCKKTVTGNDWLMSQDATMDNLEAIVLGMDDVYTLYISGSISAADFATELNVLKQEYTLVKAAYDQANKETPIKTGTHSFASQKGYDAIEGLFASIYTVLTGSTQNDTTPLSPNETAYLYLTFRDTVDGYMADYIVAYSWVYNGGGYAETATNESSSADTEQTTAPESSNAPAEAESINTP